MSELLFAACGGSSFELPRAGRFFRINPRSHPELCRPRVRHADSLLRRPGRLVPRRPAAFGAHAHALVACALRSLHAPSLPACALRSLHAPSLPACALASDSLKLLAAWSLVHSQDSADFDEVLGRFSRHGAQCPSATKTNSTHGERRAQRRSLAVGARSKLVRRALDHHASRGLVVHREVSQREAQSRRRRRARSDLYLRKRP